PCAPRPRRTHACCLPAPLPAGASTWCPRSPAALGCARREFFWGNGNGADAQPLQAQSFEELAHLGRLATDARQSLDAFTSLIHGASGLAGELLTDKITMSGQVAHGPGDAPLAQPPQAAVAEGNYVALHGGPPQAGHLGSLLASQAAVQQPEYQHLAADMLLGMAVTFGVDDLLL